MPQIRLPDKLTTLFTLAEDMADGLTTHGAALKYLKKVKTYLTANPSVEVAQLGVTAVRAQLIHDHVSDARSLLHDHVSSLGALKATRDQAAEALRIRMRGTIAELKQLLPASDTRWFAFGLVPPGSQQSPEVPEGLILTAGAAGSGIVYLDWDDSPRAERYRVWRQLPGATEMVGLDSVTESDFTLTGQPLGQEIKIAIGAVNDTGESPRSPVSVITLT